MSSFRSASICSSGGSVGRGVAEGPEVAVGSATAGTGVGVGRGPEGEAAGGAVAVEEIGAAVSVGPEGGVVGSETSVGAPASSGGVVASGAAVGVGTAGVDVGASSPEQATARSTSAPVAMPTRHVTFRILIWPLSKHTRMAGFGFRQPRWSFTRGKMGRINTLAGPTPATPSPETSVPDVIYERHPGDHYAVFTLNRPDRLNAIGGGVKEALDAARADFEADTEMRCGIVTGAGRAFCAGADLKEMAENNERRRKIQADFAAGVISQAERDQALGVTFPTDLSFFSFSRSSKPFIAAINGLAIGGGMEVSLDCDIRIASTEAYFGLYEVKRGIIAGYAVQHLPRLIPLGEAMYMLLTGDRISVEDALRSRLVHEVVEPDRLMPRAVEIAKMIAANAPLSIQGTKAMGSAWRLMGMEETKRVADWTMRYLGESDDAKEGPQAFAEKREPRWTGR